MTLLPGGLLPAASGGNEDLGSLDTIVIADRTTDSFSLALNGAKVHANGTAARQLQKALARVMSSYSGRENKDESATVTIGPLT